MSHVVLSDIEGPALHATTEQSRATGADVHADVAKPEQVEQLAAVTLAFFTHPQWNGYIEHCMQNVLARRNPSRMPPPNLASLQAKLAARGRASSRWLKKSVLGFSRSLAK